MHKLLKKLGLEGHNVSNLQLDFSPDMPVIVRHVEDGVINENAMTKEQLDSIFAKDEVAKEPKEPKANVIAKVK